MILEPLKEYVNTYKRLHEKNVSAFFEELVKESGINEKENKEIIKEINNSEKELQNITKKVLHLKGCKNLFIFISIALLCVCAYLIYYIRMFKYSFYYLLSASICGIGGVLLLFCLVNNLDEKIKGAAEYETKLKQKIKEEYQKAWKQMLPLNNLYDWDIPVKLIEKTLGPIIKFDENFNNERWGLLHHKYGLIKNDERNNNSTVFCYTGEINKNPFFFFKEKQYERVEKNYQGYLDIEWYETEKDYQGNTVTVKKTQRLFASVIKPYPRYYYNSGLIYGHDAAPNLTFSRTPKGTYNASEKEIKKFVDKQEKAICKIEQKNTTKGQECTTMDNAEFDALFGALDRDNEVEFRLIFTPLAQRNILELIKDKSVSFGDDFSFYKMNTINYITSNNVNKFDINTYPERYVSYNLSDARKIFNQYNNNFFKVFYFSIAPLLSIPIYQESCNYESEEYIDTDSNLSGWEHEAIVNEFNIDDLKHSYASKDKNILKTELITSGKDIDIVLVTAYGFQEVTEVDYVKLLGKDGNYHNVPVEWVHCYPVSKQSVVAIKKLRNYSRNKFMSKVKEGQLASFLTKKVESLEHVVYKKGILAFILNTTISNEENEELEKILYS